MSTIELVSSSASVCVDCPICLELLPSSNKNRVVTECGHVFHTSCLLTNVLHNGFGCPYCRALLAKSEAVTVSEDDDDDDEDYDPDELNDGMVLDVENVTHTDYVLRGLRWFLCRVSGDEQDDEEDVVPDDMDLSTSVDPYGEDMFSSDSQAVPPVSYIRNKLLTQGITMDDLVKVLMYRTSDRSFGDAEDEDYERLSRSLHGRMCGIISSYEATVSVPELSINDLD